MQESIGILGRRFAIFTGDNPELEIALDFRMKAKHGGIKPQLTDRSFKDDRFFRNAKARNRMTNRSCVPYSRFRLPLR